MIEDINSLNIINYKKMLDLFRNAGYVFRKFQDLNNESKHIVILRHDIDFSLDHALSFAQLESQSNIAATYFIHLKSALYNPLNPYAFNIISKISSMGHDVSLHVTFIDNPQLLINETLKQLEIIKKEFSFANSAIVSFHKIGEKAHAYQDLIVSPNTAHTYEKKFFSDIGYYSDSGGRWRFGNPLHSIDFINGKSMQILTHPLWWIEEGSTPQEKIHNFLKNTNSHSIDLIEKTIISFSLRSPTN